MILSSITVCLVPEASSGPFVFHGDMEEACARAARHGFDAVEIFPRSAEELNAKKLRQVLDRHGLKLAAMGTGAGWLTRQLSLTSPEPEDRRRAISFVAEIIDLASGFGAPAIIGSMQGRHQGEVGRDEAFRWLGEALEQLGPRAHAAGTALLLEPLNRYESNLCNRLSETCLFLRTLRTRNVRLLCDLFHMNIEEPNLGKSLCEAGEWVGHVHFADSNRQAVGLGHTDMSGVKSALLEIGYDGYLSAEIFPLPDPDKAAAQTMNSFRAMFRG